MPFKRDHLLSDRIRIFRSKSLHLPRLKGTIVPRPRISLWIQKGYDWLCPDCACIQLKPWIFAQRHARSPAIDVQPESRIKPLFWDASFRLRNCRLDVDMCIPRFTDKEQRMRQEEGGFATVTICVNYSFPTSQLRLKDWKRYVIPGGQSLDCDDLIAICNSHKPIIKLSSVFYNICLHLITFQLT